MDLSDKELIYFSGALVPISEGFETKGVLRFTDVKEALKEFIEWSNNENNGCFECRDSIVRKIKEIFGEKLIN